MDDFEKNINASDLIDWIMCAFPDWCEGDVRKIVDHIDEMPSAQPEIIRCRDCKKCQIDSIYHDYWCDGRKVWKDHYCGYAERRTDEQT